TGALGIEALSRGAKKAFFVERERHALRLIQKNLTQCGMEGQSEILPKDAIRAIGLLEVRGKCFDLIFVDPPYERGWVEKTVETLSAHRIYHERSVLVVQRDRREPLPESLGGWTLVRDRRMGDTVVSFLVPSSSPGDPGNEAPNNHCKMSG
ncbi:MAG: hypothetical protein EHM36_02670, partial [Deltaproteobacteria bacterium]